MSVAPLLGLHVNVALSFDIFRHRRVFLLLPHLRVKPVPRKELFMRPLLYNLAFAKYNDEVYGTEHKVSR